MTAEQLKANQSNYITYIRSQSGGLRSAMVRFVDLIWTWRAIARSRYALSQLSDHALKDVGLTRCDVYRECAKPFWRE
jgi:uncharacterized protein YjiS (DUF1127 family)